MFQVCAPYSILGVPLSCHENIYQLTRPKLKYDLPLFALCYTSQASIGGSPTHPAYPSGHATQNGAFATIIKVSAGPATYLG